MKIHFVWLGKNQGPHCTATPLAVKKECPNDEVWLWVLKGNAKEFTGPLAGTTVRIMLLDSPEGPLGADDWVADSLNVIKTLIHYKAWAAAKDIAVLLIMFKYGGLYFDTTCILATPAECREFALAAGVKVQARTFSDAVWALANAGDKAVPALPLVAKDEVDYQPGVLTAKSITIGYDSKEEKQHPIFKMPHIDVWGYFSPAQHAIFFGAIKSYIQRAKALGLDDKDSPNTRGKDELAGDHRDEVIGILITHSIFDGLTGALGVDPKAIEKVCWRAARFTKTPTNLPPGGDDKVNADILPEMGLIKQYKGSWRQGVAAIV
jgi:hypothetical protein